MVTNKIAHLFIVHVINNLDDTVVSKKKILNDILMTIDENITDKCFNTVFLGIYAPKSKRYFQQEEINASQRFDAGIFGTFETPQVQSKICGLRQVNFISQQKRI